MVINIIRILTGFKRLTKQLVMVLLDSLFIIFIALSSISIRLEYFYWPKDDIFWLIFAAPFIAIPIFVSFGFYNTVIRYIGSNGMLKIIAGVSLYSMFWGLADYIFILEGIDFVQGMPNSIIFINWVLCALIIGASRFLAQKLLNYEHLPNIKNIIIYGAGSSGVQLSNALKLSKEYNHISYLDDDKSLIGTYLNGIKVVNPSIK